jgi:5-methyltetrahydropteroyltriglutamate--homocysteine methyltransferase
MGHRVNYGAWFSYAFNRLSGLERTSSEVPAVPPRKAYPDELVLLGILKRRDRVQFAAAYADPESGISIGRQPLFRPICVGPVKYTGQDAIRADIAHFKAALTACGVSEGS